MAVGIGTVLAGTVCTVVDITENEDRDLITEEKLEWLNKTYQNDLKPYCVVGNTLVGGFELKGKTYTNGGIMEYGADGSLYMMTYGMTDIYIACDSCNGLKDDGASVDDPDCETCKESRLIYYDADILTQLYEVEYRANLKECNCDERTEGNKCYAHNVLDYLKRCYIFSTSTEGDVNTDDPLLSKVNALEMYSKREIKQVSKSLEYADESKNATNITTGWEKIASLFGSQPPAEQVVRPMEPIEDKPNDLQTIFYGAIAQEYAVPIELMVTMLYVTRSKDFVDAFIEMVGSSENVDREKYNVQLKLYTLRNKEITSSVEQWSRESDIIANRNIKNCTVSVQYKNKEGLSWENNVKAEGVSGTIKIRDDAKGSFDIQLDGEESNHYYYVKVEINGENVFDGWVDGDSKSIAYTSLSGATKYTEQINPRLEWSAGTLIKDAPVLEDGIVTDPAIRSVFNAQSDVTQIKGDTISTDYYVPAVSKVITWYGKFTAINTINRRYDLTQRIGTDVVTFGDYAHEIYSEFPEYETYIKSLFEPYWDEPIAWNSNNLIDGPIESIIVEELKHRDSWDGSSLYSYILGKESVKSETSKLPIVYYNLEDYAGLDWDNEYSSTTNTKISDYEEMIETYRTFWEDGKIKLGITVSAAEKGEGEVFTEEELRNIQMNFIMQADSKKSYDDLKNYTVESFKQSDSGLGVYEFKMNYTEEIVDGITSGNAICDYYELERTFLGLLCNKEGEYQLGRTFLPRSRGGQLVKYKDLDGDLLRAGELLENGQTMICSLLEASMRTQKIVPVIKMAMHMYAGEDYTISDWDFNIFVEEEWKDIVIGK